MIAVSHLSKHFTDIRAVDDISFTIKTGEITGFLGPNGAGKSTTLKMLSAYIQPTSGEIIIDGKQIDDHFYDIRKDIGYLPETNPLYDDLIVYDYLKYMARLKDIPSDQINNRIKEVAKKCGITDRLSQIIGTLSKGYRQRVGLAQAILNYPKILILDEPTIGLDPNQILEIRALITEMGQDRTVILSSHILPEIQAICERIMIINHGRLIADTTKDTLLRDIRQKNIIHLVLNKYLSPEIFLSIDENIILVKKDDDAFEYVFQYPAEMDFRESFFDKVCDNNAKIIELSTEQQKLEDVFSLLTQKPSADSRQPSADSRQQSTVSRQPSAISEGSTD